MAATIHLKKSIIFIYRYIIQNFKFNFLKEYKFKSPYLIFQIMKYISIFFRSSGYEMARIKELDAGSKPIYYPSIYPYMYIYIYTYSEKA